MMLSNQPIAGRRQAPAAPLYQQLPPAASRSDAQNSAHAPAFAIGTVIIFCLFSRASEFIDTTGRLHLVLVFAILGVFALLVNGGFGKVASTRPGIWLSLFTGWIVLGLPFSSWRGGSFHNFADMWVKSYLIFFLVAGLIFTVQQSRKSMTWLAIATIAMLYFAVRSGENNAADERFSVSYGTLGNSNDLAGSLLMGLPFLLFVAMGKRSPGILRLVCGGVSVALLLVVLRTGSRGGLITVGVLTAVAFWKSSGTKKVMILGACTLMVLLFPFVVPKSMVARYATMFKSDTSQASSAETASAIDSTNARTELMRQGMRITMHHPVFGVGLGNFSDQSANLQMAQGENPMWFTCHDIYLLVSSETGIPGFIFYIGVIVSCFKILLRLQKNSKNIPERQDISDMAFFVMVSMISFLVCGIFSTSAYTFQLPLLAGLATALDRVSAPIMRQPNVNLAPPAPFMRRPSVGRLVTAPSAAGPL